jgi:hypothetical protein
MQSKAEPNTPNPHTGRETGLNNLSRGPGETAYRGPASGTHRDIRAQPTQGRVAPAKGNAKLPERPQDEGGPREARPASLSTLSSVTERDTPNSMSAERQRVEAKRKRT